MSLSPKEDKNLIIILEKLSKRFKNIWWPKYLFHSTDILNIVKILERGVLYSRIEAKRLSLLQVDSASKPVLDATRGEMYDYVRLYFRPRTPTLYWVEGFCPGGVCSEEHQAHCPMPVYLVFNSAKTLSLPEIKFSDGNMGSGWSKLYDNINQLSSLPFDKIYHDSPLTDKIYKREIVHHRCAEVLVHKELPLNGYLSAIICRSEAERETLLNLIGPQSTRIYSRMIKVWQACFFCKRQYIRKVSLYDNCIEIAYNSHLDDFQYKFIMQTADGIVVEKVHNKRVSRLNIMNPKDQYIFSVYIDDHIAYKGELIDVRF